MPPRRVLRLDDMPGTGPQRGGAEGVIAMRRIGMIVVLVVASTLTVSAVPALASQATDNHASYTWVIGADPPGSSDTAMAADGSTIALSGSGHLQAGPGHFANGGGTYTLTRGGQTTSGSFTVTGIGGFVSYGSAAAQGLPANLFGGQAQLDVSLDNGSSGLLTITCELGSPPAGHMEGIAVVLGPGGAFTKEVSGNNVFIHS
jgi:hypothetical protein